ncbi:extracellular solute-binding protein [Nitratireductor sp. XY-223]|uniref:ABC transporter substrate-binding protein n=1 Tax=Nitratireductor sp. XY-223 TaxID=2561926 RepID=UPI001FEE4C40|nr:extracellular solute-binding protein [Nitratireductor sp. XY-223]
MTFTGPQIAEPLQRRAPDFERATGAKINVITVPFSDLHSKLLTDWATGTNSIDAAVLAPQWAVDYVGPGFLEKLTERVAADPDLKEDDIAPFFREFSRKYSGDTYMLTLDGDFQMAYYRSDIFKDNGTTAPETWDDYIAAAKALHGKDLNGDGSPDYVPASPRSAARRLTGRSIRSPVRSCSRTARCWRPPPRCTRGLPGAHAAAAFWWPAAARGTGPRHRAHAVSVFDG